jgi:hypothetical protein
MKKSSHFSSIMTAVLLVVTLISTTGTTFAKNGSFSKSPAETQIGNLAIGKKATQSSVYKSASASRAVDGNSNGTYSKGSVTHTKANSQAWWQVDLGKKADLTTIEIWPRTDCCEWRSSNIYVLVSDYPFKSTRLNTARAQTGVSSYFIAGNLEKPSTIDVNRSGRYIRVQLSGRDYLSLAEVVVNGITGVIPTKTSVPSFTPTATKRVNTSTPTKLPELPTTIPSRIPTKIPTQIPTQIPTNIPTSIPTGIPTINPTPTTTKVSTLIPTSVPTQNPTATFAPTNTPGNSFEQTVLTNVADGKLAIQSSVYDGAVAIRAVDGNTDGNLRNNSVTHTNEDYQAWWQVDLGGIYQIQLINLWNRSDCCEWRASNVYILVSETPILSGNLDEARNQTGVTSYFVNGTVGRPSMASINARGQFVRVQLTGKDFLSLAEVEVFSSSPAIVPENTPIPTLAPMNTATPTIAPTDAPTSTPIVPTGVPTSEPTMIPDLPTSEPQPTEPAQVVDQTSVVRLAWFYNPPTARYEELVASNFSSFYLAMGSTQFRDLMRSRGNESPFYLYLLFNSIFDMGSCDIVPTDDQVAFLAGDFCNISEQHPDWFLLDTAGNRIREDYGNGQYLVYMDPSNAGWREFWLGRARGVIEEEGLNGVFLDNMDAGLERFIRINQMPANYPDEASLQAAYSDFAAYINNTYFEPNGLRLVANITEGYWRDSGWMSYLDNLDGMMDEGFGVNWEDGYYSREHWETQLNNLDSLQANGKEIVFVSQGVSDDLGRQQFAFGSYMLVANGVSSFRYVKVGSYSKPWVYDNYSIILGSPLGTRYQDGDNWVRDFSNGKIIVNPDAHTTVFQMNQ